MKHEMFAIFDSKADAFLNPFFMLNAQMAIRTFSGCANDTTHMFNKHPSDFRLYKIAYFDDASALIEPIQLLDLGLAAIYINKGE